MNKSRKETGYVAVPGIPVSLTIASSGVLAFASGEEQDTVFIVSVSDRKRLKSFKTAAHAGPDPVFDYPGK